MLSVIMDNAFLLGVVSSVAGAAVITLVQYLQKSAQEYSGHYTGTWETRVVDQSGSITKKDDVVIRQRRSMVHGTIFRRFPNDMSHRSWNFVGRVGGENMFAIFWPTDDSIPSYGCWFVHQVDDFTFSGYYLSLDSVASAIAPIKVELSRKKIPAR